MSPDLRDLLEKVEAGRAELFRVADTEAAEEDARAIQGQRAGLGGSPLLEPANTADVLGLVVDALRGEEPGAGR